MIEILLAVFSICIIFLILPHSLPQVAYFVVICMLKFKWRKNFMKLILKGNSNITTKGLCTIPEEIDLIEELDERIMDRISFYGFREDGVMIAISQHKVANVKKNRILLWNSDENVFLWEGELIEQKPIQKMFTGKMTVKILEPLKKWRITFQGFLRNVSRKETSIYANISLLWQCSSDPYECMQTSNSWSFAKFCTERLLTYSQLKKIFAGQTFRFDQWGLLSGNLDINQSGQTFLRFDSARSRAFSVSNERAWTTQTIHYIKMKEKCWMLMLMKTCLDDFKPPSAYIKYPNGEIWPLTFGKASSDTTVHTTFMDETLFTQDGDCKILKISCQHDAKRNVTEFASETFQRYYVNDEAAFGCQVTEEFKLDVLKMSLETSAIHQYVYDEEDCDIPLTISLKDSMSKRSDVVGGKGASLSKLLAMEHELGVIIPKGFCLTTKAYAEHIQENEELASIIESMHYCVSKKQVDQLQRYCEQATVTITQTRISAATKAVLINQLHTHFGAEYKNKLLAVRSSALGEDGLETSSAGQMETILNVKGFDSVLQAILKCWASSLSFDIVEYRRQNGQRLLEPMAVVVQKMIKSEVSGVLFTADPSANNGSILVINALPGLGEDVVSGKSNVDTIFITRTPEQNMFIKQRLPAKSKEDRDTCISEQDVCLREETTLKICQAAILLEDQFGFHIDIEWAVAHGCIYFLQARPIVSVLGETDEEIIHEFDTPVTDWKECLTTGNIGEMLPGIATPLTIDIFGRAVDLAVKVMNGWEYGLRYSAYASMTLCAFYYRLFLSLSVPCSTAIHHLIYDKNKVEMFFLGETLPENSVQNLISFCGRKPSLLSRLTGLIKTQFAIWKAGKVLIYYEQMLKESTMNHSSTDLNDLMKDIETKHEHYFKVWRAAMYQNVQACVGSAMMLSSLCGTLNKITPDISADLASLLSNCKNVCSADVPTALADLAKIIIESNQKDYFINLSDDESHSFFISSEVFGEKYQSFLDRHGHRCVREAEFSELSWAMKPTKLIQCLKSLVCQGKVDIQKELHCINDIVDRLRTPLTYIQKLLLKHFLVSFARKGVAKREWGKSIAIKMGDKLKQVYWNLADLMVQECRLPENDLLFYLTHSEIKALISKRSPELVRRSRKRRNISKTAMLYNFNKINYGAPKPLPMDLKLSGSPLAVVQGMSVSRGIVTARACVIKDVSEVGEIHKGDILVCMFTDVGWTPYFPLLSGIVTEIGGLLSHGAVVAREYGLPCIVCMSDATKMFKTGDIVKLNATDGTLSRIGTD